ncbi:9150_t:CDS:2 [Funneliformis geosporum]|uniref:9150_t:CDS:1 n=1 Tax=Funneliformis geosporum TaxID=1117311 RepID=A0A9W4SNH6_9GLOM|nr:9150_t:CDS:2 [Funneliformis geosporum]
MITIITVNIKDDRHFFAVNQLTKEYLGITATSVSSEHLFSVISNIIFSKKK